LAKEPEGRNDRTSSPYVTSERSGGRSVARAFATVETEFFKCSRSCRSRQLGGVERLERIDCLDRLRPHIPFEEPQHNLIGQEVDDRKAVLLDGLDLLLQVEVRRWQRASAASCQPTNEQLGELNLVQLWI
jgi:hypothetical protein